MVTAYPIVIMADFVRPGDYEIAFCDLLCNRLRGRNRKPRSFLLDSCWIECLKNDLRDEALKEGEDGWLYYSLEIVLTNTGEPGQAERFSELVLSKLEALGIRAELVGEN